MDTNVLLARAKQVAEMDVPHGRVDIHTGIIQGALTLVNAFYGADSPQLRNLERIASNGWATEYQAQAIQEMLRSLIAEIDIGAVGSVRRALTGEVLADLLGLSRDALAEDQIPVAAVLAAAAFEDTVRRMGREFGGVDDRPQLADVLTRLKEKGVIEGPQVGIAQSYLKFRNDALHADWASIDRAAVSSNLGFVEELLLKHFA